MKWPGQNQNLQPSPRDMDNLPSDRERPAWMQAAMDNQARAHPGFAPQGRVNYGLIHTSLNFMISVHL